MPPLSIAVAVGPPERLGADCYLNKFSLPGSEGRNGCLRLEMDCTIEPISPTGQILFGRPASALERPMIDPDRSIGARSVWLRCSRVCRPTLPVWPRLGLRPGVRFRSRPIKIGRDEDGRRDGSVTPLPGCMVF